MLIMFSAFGSKRSKHHYLCFGYISHLLMKSLWPFAKISILYSISKFFSMVAHQGSASDRVPGSASGERIGQSLRKRIRVVHRTESQEAYQGSASDRVPGSASGQRIGQSPRKRIRVALRTEFQEAHQGSASEFRSYPNA